MALEIESPPMSRNKPRKTTVSIGLQVEPETLDKLDALAEQQTRSRANLLLWMVQRVLREFDAKASPTPDASRRDDAAVA